MTSQKTMGKPRLGYVLKMYPRFSETFIVSEILALERAGFEIDIFSLRSPVDGRFHQFLSEVAATVTYIDAHPTKAIRFWKAIHDLSKSAPGLWSTLKAAGGEDVDDTYQALILSAHAIERGITHLHAHFASVATQVARLAAQICSISFSFTTHAKDIYHESVNIDNLKEMIAAAKFCVTVSDYNLKYLSSIAEQSHHSIHRIYNGLDLDRFRPNFTGQKDKRIVAVGRLVEKKGFVYLVKAIAELRSRGFEIPCSIIGTGDLETDLKATIEGLGIGDLVVLCGPKTQDAVAEAISSASMFIAPCLIASDGNRDGLPTVLLEAMALGTPCISTDVTGIPEIIRHRETGLIVPQCDSKKLADAIQTLYNNPVLGESLARNARKLIEENFNSMTNAQQLASLFLSLCVDQSSSLGVAV